MPSSYLYKPTLVLTGNRSDNAKMNLTRNRDKAVTTVPLYPNNNNALDQALKNFSGHHIIISMHSHHTSNDDIDTRIFFTQSPHVTERTYSIKPGKKDDIIGRTVSQQEISARIVQVVRAISNRTKDQRFYIYIASCHAGDVNEGGYLHTIIATRLAINKIPYKIYCHRGLIYKDGSRSGFSASRDGSDIINSINSGTPPPNKFWASSISK